MAKHNDLGKRGEEIAAQYLSEKGYEILERNWRNKHKEIDIIAKDKEELVVVEVKTRQNDEHGEPDIAVGITKQKMLIWAADAYVRYKNLDVDVRFDIISIVISDAEPEIEHIEDAFVCTSR